MERSKKGQMKFGVHIKSLSLRLLYCALLFGYQSRVELIDGKIRQMAEFVAKENMYWFSDYKAAFHCFMRVLNGIAQIGKHTNDWNAGILLVFQMQNRKKRLICHFHPVSFNFLLVPNREYGYLCQSHESHRRETAQFGSVVSSCQSSSTMCGRHYDCILFAQDVLYTPDPFNFRIQSVSHFHRAPSIGTMHTGAYPLCIQSPFVHCTYIVNE